MGTPRHLLQALVLVSFGLATMKASALCPHDDPDRYEEDNHSGYCYDKWTGEYFNEYESIRPGDPGHPEFYDWGHYYDADAGEIRRIPNNWTELDVWLAENPSGDCSGIDDPLGFVSITFGSIATVAAFFGPPGWIVSALFGSVGVAVAVVDYLHDADYCEKSS
ncbi:MAG: hypothetical protein OXU77_13020 [Gammaproteobacteria bacterium]|nr:hypothetical protein [Gammaproteobacteria bacterium]MDE0442887.1 hypothetical protein [Gammaproteobacteria bacterium]